MNITLDIQELTARQDEDGSVTLWRVVGIDNKWYPTKMCAEAVARRVYPHEDWYRRIYHRTFYDV